MKNEKEIKKLEKAVEDINKRIDKLKEEKHRFEVGKWYKWGEFFIYVTSLPNGKLKGYGLDEGEWFDNRNDSTYWGFDIDANFILADQETVEAALIAEAKKRGFKKGVKFKRKSAIHVGYTEGIIGCSHGFQNTYKSHIKTLEFGGCYIFQNGQWAEIIEEPKVVINGYEMKQEGDIVSFGCAKFDKSFIKDAQDSIRILNDAENYGDKQNRNIKSITLDSGVEMTVKQLKEIVGNLK